MTDNDLLSIFKAEVSEYLESLNNTLLQIEMIDPTDPTLRPMLIEMNRLAHSMKGAARAVGIKPIETVAYYMEEIYSAALRNRLHLTPDTADTLYDGLDLIQRVMDGDEIEDDILSEIVANFKSVIDRSTGTDSQIVAVVPAVQTDDDDDFDDAAGEDDPPIRAESADSGGTFRRPAAIPAHPAASPGTPASRADQRPTTTMNRRDTTTVPAVTEAQTLSLRPLEETVRVTVGKLDRLMGEATELLVARLNGEARQGSIQDLRRSLAKWQREWRTVRAAYIRLMRRIQDGQEKVSPELATLLKFVESNQRHLLEVNQALARLAGQIAQDNMQLATLTEQFQDDIGSMRLIPFDFVVSGFQRTVRDLAREMNKQIQLDITGAHVEFDKTVLDQLRDPLMHLIRNAVDHGIEPPVEREHGGKSPTGRIHIDIEQRGSEIILSISDDGRGIDLDRVRQSIVRQKLLAELEAQSLSDDEVRFYIFHPGLTTSDKVTAVSGRGMGMDIVRDRVESLRGRISIYSERRTGTTVRLNVPVSLTRIRCILLRLGEQVLALPSVVIARMQTLARSELFTAEGQEMTVINGQPVPVVALGALLDIPSASTSGELRDELQVILIQTTNRAVAFEVDELLSEQELILKPLGREIAGARYVSGAAVSGTGDVLIVLDASSLMRAASGLSLPRRRAAPTASSKQPRQLRVLVVDDSITTRTLEKNILETAGFDVQTAIDGVEGWLLLNEREFDLVITDVEMPRMNGLDLTLRIRQTGGLRDLPIILLTSLGKPEQKEAGLRAGADAYLIKSQFDQSELLTTIQSLL